MTKSVTIASAEGLGLVGWSLTDANVAGGNVNVQTETKCGGGDFGAWRKRQTDAGDLRGRELSGRRWAGECRDDCAVEYEFLW